jgi:hypothetical protein
MGEIEFPGGERRMWTVNPFEGHRDSDDRRKQLSVNILESFERMGLAQLGTMANIRGTINNAINMAMTLPDPTYLDLLLIVISEQYRKHLLATRKHIDHITRVHWENLDDPKLTTRFQRRSEIQTSRNRLEHLLNGSDFNLPAGSYTSSLRLQEWLDNGKMIIIDLGLPVVRETGIALGNLIMAQLMTDIFLRAPGNRDRTWRLIVDEMHLFVGANFAEIITGARSFNVFPVFAHQDRGQLPKRDDSPLLGSLGHSDITLHLRGSREDRPALASLFGQDAVDIFFSLNQHSAICNYFSSLAGSYSYEIIGLNNFWADPVPGQLAELQLAAYAHTVPKKDLVEHNRRRYWDYLEGGGYREPRKDDATSHTRPDKPKTKADSPPEIRPRPEAGKAGGLGGIAGEPEHPPRPGVARPPRVVDEWDDSGSALPRPPTRKRKPK